MRTDIPLKKLTELYGADLLPLLGVPADTLIEVMSRELPASAARLDTVLRVRSPQGQEYIHILEWQGYPDRVVLWRLTGYMAWYGQQEPDIVIVGSIIYLRPADDMGNVLSQVVDGEEIHRWGFGQIRLWEQDALAALASGRLGLIVLSPLMRNASAELVQQAIDSVFQQAPLPQRGDLLSILGVFATPFIPIERFVNIVGREQLMSSDLFEYLMRETRAEWEAEREAMEAERQVERQALEAEHEKQLAARDAQLQQTEQQAQQATYQAQQAAYQAQQMLYAMQQMLEDSLHQHVPAETFALLPLVRRITDPQRLRQLIQAVPQTPDLPALTRMLEQAAEAGSQPNGDE